MKKMLILSVVLALTTSAANADPYGWWLHDTVGTYNRYTLKVMSYEGTMTGFDIGVNDPSGSMVQTTGGIFSTSVNDDTHFLFQTGHVKPPVVKDLFVMGEYEDNTYLQAVFTPMWDGIYADGFTNPVNVLQVVTSEAINPYADLAVYSTSWAGPPVARVGSGHAAYLANIHIVPEPSALVILWSLLGGLGVMGGWRRSWHLLHCLGDSAMKKTLILSVVLALTASAANADVLGEWIHDTVGTYNRYTLRATSYEGTMTGFDIAVYDPSGSMVQTAGGIFSLSVNDDTHFLFQTAHVEPPVVTDLLVLGEYEDNTYLQAMFAPTGDGDYGDGFTNPVNVLQVVTSEAINPYACLAVYSTSSYDRPRALIGHGSSKYVTDVYIVPEPGVLTLLVLGGLGIAAMLWRQRKRA